MNRDKGMFLKIDDVDVQILFQDEHTICTWDWNMEDCGLWAIFEYEEEWAKQKDEVQEPTSPTSSSSSTSIQDTFPRSTESLPHIGILWETDEVEDNVDELSFSYDCETISFMEKVQSKNWGEFMDNEIKVIKENCSLEE